MDDPPDIRERSTGGWWGRLHRKGCGVSASSLIAKLSSFFPILTWLPSYDWRVSFFGDLSGGLTMGVFNVPQGIALAAITGVNPVYGLYTAIFPSFFYTLFGTSKHNALGGFAVLSVVTATAIEKVELIWSAANVPVGGRGYMNVSDFMEMTNGSLLYDTGGSNETTLLEDMQKAGPNSIAIATTLLFMAGMMQILMGVLHLHHFVCYFSEQIMSGFIVGGVVHVFFAQIGPALGLDLPVRNGPGYLYYRLFDVIDRVDEIHMPTVVISLSSIVFLIEFIGPWLDEVFLFPVPFELILVIVGITAMNFAELASRHTIAVVGNMPTNFPPPSLPRLELSFTLFAEAASIAMIATIIHIKVAKFVEKRYDYRVDYGQELYALGFVGVLSSFFPVFPVTSGFQRSVVGAAVGGSTQLTCLFSSLLLLTVILYIGPALEYLPKCVLAAIMLVSLKNSFLKICDLRKLWPTFKIDAVIFVATMLLTICYDMTFGLIIAVVFAFVTTALRSQWPKWHFLTRDESGRYTESSVAYVDRDSIVVTYDGPLLYTGTGRFMLAIKQAVTKYVTHQINEASFATIEDMVDHGDQKINDNIARLRLRKGKKVKKSEEMIRMVIDTTRIPFVDYEGVRTLEKVFIDQQHVGVEIVFVVNRDDLIRKFEATDFYKVVGRDRVFPTIEKAVEDGLQKHHAPLIQLDSAVTTLSSLDCSSPPSLTLSGPSFDGTPCSPAAPTSYPLTSPFVDAPPTPAPMGDLFPVTWSRGPVGGDSLRVPRGVRQPVTFDYEEFLYSEDTEKEHRV